MYVLMNKDQEIAFIRKEKSEFEDEYRITSCKEEKLPIGFEDIESWIDKRQAAKHREHLRKLMLDCDCLSREGFIKFTHATSLNDTFWIKGIDENISWDRVSLYQNEFNEMISRIAFEGIGLFGMQFSSTTPEFSTAGAFEKCWRREGDEIFLYKRGSTGAGNAGREPLSEIYAGQLAKYICRNNFVEYLPGRLHKKEAAKCKIFTNEKIGFASFSNIINKKYSIKDTLEYFHGIGSEDDFRRMIVFDGIVFNTDRHTGNYGIIFDNDTLEVLKMAPVFDYNQALLPYAVEEELLHPNDYLRTKAPKLGDDFLRSAKAALTPEIRADLINLHGFHFQYIDSDKFDLQRVKLLERLVNRQIEGILDKSKIYMVDLYKESTSEKLTNNKLLLSSRGNNHKEQKKYEQER